MTGNSTSEETTNSVQVTKAGQQEVRVLALGVAIDVEGLSLSEAAEFRRAWSRCLAAQDRNAASIVRRNPGDFAQANESLTSAITLAAIEQLAGRFMMFHACGLEDPVSGATVAFIAPSGTGKTTLAMSLGTKLGYISDETIAVDADMRIVTYPKPLSIKQDQPGIPKHQLSPDKLHLGPTPSAPTLQTIAILDRNSANNSASLDSIALVDAILELTPQLSALSRLDRGLVQLCQMIDSCGGVKRISYAEASDIEGLLPALMRPTRTAQKSRWRALDLLPGNEVPKQGQALRRAPLQDAVEVDDVVLLLAESRVIELGPLGTVIWDLSYEWISSSSLLQAVIEILGDHSSSAALFDAAVEELVSQRVLVRA